MPSESSGPPTDCRSRPHKGCLDEVFPRFGRTCGKGCHPSEQEFPSIALSQRVPVKPLPGNNRARTHTRRLCSRNGNVLRNIRSAAKVLEPGDEDLSVRESGDDLHILTHCAEYTSRVHNLHHLHPHPGPQRARGT